MGIPLSHPAIIQAIERGLIRLEDLHPVAPTSTTGTKPRAAHKPVATIATTPGRWLIMFTVPCTVVSEANRRDHWAVSKRRADAQEAALRLALESAGLMNHRPPLPITVTFTRIGRQKMDDDNLARSFKALRDRLAEWIGVDDGGDEIEWDYEQRAGKPGVEVTIESRSARPVPAFGP